MSTKTPIDHLFVLPPELAEHQRTCQRIFQENTNNLAPLVQEIIDYQRTLIRTIQSHFTLEDGETQKVYNPETQEISPSAFASFKSQLQAHIVEIIGCMGLLVQQNACNPEPLTWFTVHYAPLFNRRLRESRLENCVISQEEIIRREEQATTNGQSIANSDVRKNWMALSAVVTVQTISGLIVGPAGLTLTTAALKIVADTAATTVLHTGMATVDDACCGRASLKNTGNSALKGASYGAASSTLSTAIQAGVGAYFNSTPKNEPPTPPPEAPIRYGLLPTHTQTPMPTHLPGPPAIPLLPTNQTAGGSTLMNPPSPNEQLDEQHNETGAAEATFEMFYQKLDEFEAAAQANKTTTKTEQPVYHQNNAFGDLIFQHKRATATNQQPPFQPGQHS